MKPGDEVIFLHEKGSGIIRRIENNVAWVETDKGIEIPFALSELIIPNKKIVKEQSSLPKNKEKQKEKKNTAENVEEFDWDIHNRTIPKVKDPNFRVDISYLGESPHKNPKISATREEVWEIDLHIHEIMNNFEHLSSAEILQIQLKHFHAFMKKAIQHKIRKVIIIHGVGTGRLKAEIITASLKYPVNSIYDASMKKYGKGATEILLRVCS